MKEEKTGLDEAVSVTANTARWSVAWSKQGKQSHLRPRARLWAVHMER